MNEQQFEVLIAGIVAALLLFAEHWLPWKLIIGRRLPRLAAYVMGVASLGAPLSVLVVHWGEWMSAVAFWFVAGMGGLAVMGSWLLEDYLLSKSARREAEERERSLMEGGDVTNDR